MQEIGSDLKVRWGVLGVANIAVKKVIPAMALGQHTEIVAIASRQIERARTAADQLHIATAYGSYEELLADPNIDAIYNPLPNHLHVPWSIRALEAGKHVLCEKPIALSAAETRLLMEARDRTGKKVGEAFMVKLHPQWLRTRELVRAGELGELRSILSVFSYFNSDPKNIRNQRNMGGGGLMDIGCYPITMARFLFGREPVRVSSITDRDPAAKTDRLTSAILDFGSGAQALFTCSTQMVPYQRTQVLGTKARVELEIPYNVPPHRPSRIFIDDGSQLGGLSARTEEFAAVDQYTLQGDAFSQALLNDHEVPVPLGDALANMAVIDAVFRAADSGHWEPVHA